MLLMNVKYKRDSSAFFCWISNFLACWTSLAKNFKKKTFSWNIYNQEILFFMFEHSDDIFFYVYSWYFKDIG